MEGKKGGDAKERAWELVQIKAFTSWLNGYLEKRNMQIQEIRTDLSDGVRLLNFLELLSKKKINFKYDEKPTNRIQKIQNLHLALKFFEKEMEGASLIKLVGIGAEDFADQNLKMILGFLWSLFKKFRIQIIKTDDKSSEEGLLLWAKKTTAGYRDVNVESYKHSFKDGMAFLALIDKYLGDKSVFDFDQFKKEDGIANLTKAFEVGEAKLGIPKLLEPQEVHDQNVDERSLVLYISLYFHAFVAQQQQKGMQEEKQRIEGRLKGLEEELEGRARSAAELAEENVQLKKQLEALKSQLKAEQEAKAELQEKDTYLEEKVEVLKQLLDQENEEKEELEQSKHNLEKEVEELKTKLEATSKDLETNQKSNQELTVAKATLELQAVSLQEQITEISGKLKHESQEREKENSENQSRSTTQVAGLEVLKKNLEEHIEDLHRWEKFLDYDKQAEIDFSGEIRPQILMEISKQNYEEQLQNLSKRLENENAELLKYLKTKETELKAKKALEKKKKERQKKADN